MTGVVVAIVMPAHNAARHIGEALASVVAQTVPHWRLIVVDDGSTDATSRLARTWPDPRILVHTMPHAGPALARNIGLSLAGTAPWVAFLDADDVWAPAKLERQLQALTADRALAGVGTCTQYISARGRALGRAGSPLSPEAQQRLARAEHFPFPLSTLVARRDAVEAAGAFDATLGLRGAEDLDFYARLARQGRVACLPEVLTSYRIHPHSFMATHARTASMAARFVTARRAARDRGGDLAWEAFAAGYHLTWTERRRDLAFRAYRRAAIAVAEGDLLPALVHGSLALAASPRYTLPRLYRQCLRGVAPGRLANLQPCGGR